MGELTTRVLNGINNAREAEDLGDCVGVAADLIRRVLSSAYLSGFEEIDQEEVGELEKTQLQEALLKALPRNSDPLYVCSILHALRGTCDPALRPLWIEYLTKYLGLLKSSNAVVFTILLALSDLDEPVFVGAMSRCSIDVQINVKEAQDYLRRHGIIVPG